MENNTLPITIKTSWLLRVYWIIPVLTIVVLADMFLFERSLTPYMGLESLLLPLYLLIFELPHIIGSFLGFADKEYLKHYRKQLAFGLPIIFAVIGGLLFWNLLVAITVYLVATMYHVIKQQTGISIMLGAHRGKLQQWWTWVGIAGSSLLYVYFLLPDMFPTVILNELNYVFFFSQLLFLALGFLVWKKTSKSTARKYVAWTTALFVVGYMFVLAGYLFFGFFLVRFVHDVTAFYFYIAHETNRNHEQTHNVIYQLLRSVPLPVYVLVPVLSVGIAYLFRIGVTDEMTIYAIVIFFGFVHYYLESLIWKRDAPHRASIKVT